MQVADGLLLDEKLADYKAAFDAVDMDGSGDINADELRLLLTRLGWDAITNTETVLNLMGKYVSGFVWVVDAVSGILHGGLSGWRRALCRAMLGVEEVGGKGRG